MRSFKLLCRCLSISLAGAGALAASTCGGQAFDMRYGLPPAAEGAPEAASSETAAPGGSLLLSYRREDASKGEVAAAREPRLASSATLDDSNPLRKAPEPQAAPASVLPALSYVAPTVESPSPELTPATPAIDNPFPPISERTEPMATPAASAPPAAVPLMRYDMAVQPAMHETETAPAGDDSSPGLAGASAGDESDASLMSRRLAPPTAGATAPSSSEKSTGPTDGALPLAFSKLESFTTAGAGLAIVIGLFLICAWSLRRGGGKAGGVLPADAFAVLGRAPLTSQSFAHLLRLGNKLVLVAMSPDGIQPLTEVTDPMEVDRLTGLCASGRGYGPSAEFTQVLAQLAKEPASGFLGAEATEGGRRR